MARVTGEEVKEIIDTTYTADEIESGFIVAANLIVTERLGSVTSISSALKKEIERWLSAHFVAIADPRLKSEKIGDALDQYRGSIGIAKGLDATYYGQQAKALDPTGNITNLGKSPVFLKQINPESTIT